MFDSNHGESGVVARTRTVALRSLNVPMTFLEQCPDAQLQTSLCAAGHQSALTIALLVAEEADESIYWLELIEKADYYLKPKLLSF